METFKSFWLILVIAVTLFETGLCIRCYQCTSRRDSKCADPMSADTRATECTRESVSNTVNEITYTVRGSPGIADVFSGNTFTCVKLNTLMNNQYQNTTVVRGCYYEKVEGKDICSILRSKIIDPSTLPFCETCTEDACNGSNRLHFSVPLATVLLPLSILYFISA